MIELASIIILGILAQWLAWRIKVPAILPLIITGLTVGPLSTLWTEDGEKLLEPIYNPETGHGLFPDQYLFYFVSLAIGIILFEGGLTLKRRELQDVGPVIFKLITLGSLVTFVGAGLAAHFVMGLNWMISFLFASLIVVTGPTVIAPILQNVPLNRNVSTILKWEGILIDPIGALMAVLVYEFIISGEGFGFTGHALLSFVKILLIGGALGGIMAYALYQAIKRNWVPHYLLNVLTLAVVLGVFVFSDLLEHESGLLAVVIMGMVLGNLNVPQVRDILSFKESLSILLISILFILLAANINIGDLMLLLRWECLALFGIVILILRPLGVFWSTHKSELSINEKMFVSWVGPRGIVAAGIASLFGLRLTVSGVEGASFITPLVFMVVLGTVLLNATTARLLANLLGVTQKSSDGILLIGANKAARTIGRYLHDNGRHVVLVDNNESSVEKAQKQGLSAFQANIYMDDLDDHFELVDVGYLIALTENAGVNQYACKKFQKLFGEKGTFRIISPEEVETIGLPTEDTRFFLPKDDYLNLSEAARDFPEVHEVPVESKEQFSKLIRVLDEMPKSIALFYRDKEDQIELLCGKMDEMPIDVGYTLVYLGQEVDWNEWKIEVGDDVSA